MHISTRGDVPEWLLNFVKAMGEALLLHEWQLHIEWVPNGESDTRGLAAIQPRLNYAKLSFKDTLTNDAEGYITVIHELLHVRHIRIDEFVCRQLENRLPPAESEFAIEQYRDIYEPFIELMAGTIFAFLTPSETTPLETANDDDDSAAD